MIINWREAKADVFWRRPVDISSGFCADQNQLCVIGGQTISIHDLGIRHRYFKTRHFPHPNSVDFVSNLKMTHMKLQHATSSGHSWAVFLAWLGPVSCWGPSAAVLEHPEFPVQDIYLSFWVVVFFFMYLWLQLFLSLYHPLWCTLINLNNYWMDCDEMLRRSCFPQDEL